MESCYIDLIWGYSHVTNIPKLLYAPSYSGIKEGNIVVASDGVEYKVENKLWVNTASEEFQFIKDITKCGLMRIVKEKIVNEHLFDYSDYITWGEQ